MSTSTSIEWTRGDDGSAGCTWNPVAGCTPVSPGCLHCYAAKMAHRLDGIGQAKYRGLTVLRNGVRTFNGKLTTDDGALDAPLGWRKPRRVFVNSMSDLFHEGVPYDFVDRVFGVMALCPDHTFQILTKRPERMAEYLNTPGRAEKIYGDWYVEMRDKGPGATARQRRSLKECGTVDKNYHGDHPLARKNWWLGTSVEDQQRADERIPHLLRCPAAVRFLSAEPLLGPLNLDRWLLPYVGEPADCVGRRFRHPDGSIVTSRMRGCVDRVEEAPDAMGRPGKVVIWTDGKGEKYRTRWSAFREHARFDADIHWVIVGGESGPGARPMNPAWARSLRDECAKAGTSFFFKQWGEHLPYEEDAQPPFWLGQDGRMVDAHAFPDMLSDGDPVGGWWAPDLLDGVVYRRVGKKAAGRLLDGRTWDEFPAATPQEVPVAR